LSSLWFGENVCVIYYQRPRNEETVTKEADRKGKLVPESIGRFQNCFLVHPWLNQGMKRQSQTSETKNPTKKGKATRTIEECRTIEHLSDFCCDQLRKFLMSKNLDFKGFKEELMGRIYLCKYHPSVPNIKI
jgi:hypothetical protein